MRECWVTCRDGESCVHMNRSTIRRRCCHRVFCNSAGDDNACVLYQQLIARQQPQHARPHTGRTRRA